MAVAAHPYELLADFQEVYHIDLWGIPWDRIDEDVVAHLAALAWQLAPSSRTRSATDEAGSHGYDVLLLRRMEHELHVLLWSMSEQAKNKDTRPDPIWLPGEDERHEKIVEKAEHEALRLADRLGLDL